MIEALKDDDLIRRVGGRFKLTSLVQKRWKELLFGARPMVDPAGKTLLEIAIAEILQGKIEAGGSSVKHRETRHEEE